MAYQRDGRLVFAMGSFNSLNIFLIRFSDCKKPDLYFTPKDILLRKNVLLQTDDGQHPA